MEILSKNTIFASEFSKLFFDKNRMNNMVILVATQGDIDMSLWGMVIKGGWLMIPIFLLSIWVVYISCERFWQLHKIRETDETFMQQIRELIGKGDFTTALNTCTSAETPLSRIIAKGIIFRHETPGEIRTAMENTANYEVSLLEKGLPTLATCAGTAPMIGFLGTVIGMIQAFYDMAMASNSIDIGLLSRGIYTAMITTVAGLIVGIIGQLTYNYLVAIIDGIVQNLERYNAEFIEQLVQNTDSK